jgi:hypothetical protein
MSRALLARMAGVLVAATATLALAHSASDAYLTLDVVEPAAPASAGTMLHGQWDIALRDLDFALSLDANGDGDITWGELRPRQRAIDDYAYRRLHISSAAGPCAIRPTRQLVDDHADGAYAALFFEAECPQRVTKVTLDYTLFFALDPSHRGIFVLRSGSNTSTALLSPEQARIDVPL